MNIYRTPIRLGITKVFSTFNLCHISTFYKFSGLIAASDSRRSPDPMNFIFPPFEIDINLCELTVTCIVHYHCFLEVSTISKKCEKLIFETFSYKHTQYPNQSFTCLILSCKRHKNLY